MKRQDLYVLLIGFVAFAGTVAAWWIASARRAALAAPPPVVVSNPNDGRVVELVTRGGGDAKWVFFRAVAVSDALGVPQDDWARLHKELERLAVARAIRYAYFADAKGTPASGQPVLLTTNGDLDVPTSKPGEIDLRGSPADVMGRRLAGWAIREPAIYGLGWSRN